MHDDIFSNLWNQWHTIENEILKNSYTKLSETSLKIKRILYSLISQTSMDATPYHLRHDFIKNRIDATSNYVCIARSEYERYLACKLVNDILADIAHIYHFFGPNNKPDEGFHDDFLILGTHSQQNLLKLHWTIIKEVLLYTSNKQLVFHVTHTFLMKVFLHLYWTYGSQETIRHQYFSIEVPILQELLVSASIFAYINKLESLLQNLLNNYAENNLYIIDSGLESDHEDLED